MRYADPELHAQPFLAMATTIAAVSGDNCSITTDAIESATAMIMGSCRHS